MRPATSQRTDHVTVGHFERWLTLIQINCNFDLLANIMVAPPVLQRRLRNKLQATERYMNRSS